MRWQVGGGGPVNAARKHVIYQCMRRDAAKARSRPGSYLSGRRSYFIQGVTADLTRRDARLENLTDVTRDSRSRRCATFRMSWSEISKIERQPSHSNEYKVNSPL